MSRLFSPDYRPPSTYKPASANGPQESGGGGYGGQADMQRPAYPRQRLYDSQGNRTGARIGGKPMRHLDQHGRPTGKLELGSLGAERRAQAEKANPFEARMERIRQARADGSFDAKRAAFNGTSKDSQMDEHGNILPRAQTEGADAGKRQLLGQQGGSAAPAQPGGSATPPQPGAGAGTGQPQPGGKAGPGGAAPVAGGSAAAPSAEENALLAQGLYDQRSGVTQRGADGSVLFNSGGFIERNRPGQNTGATLQSPHGSGSVEFLPAGSARQPGRLSDESGKAASSNFFQEHADRTGVANKFAKPRQPGRR